MTHYAKLKYSGELTKDACRAILFNPNLTSYNEINFIATETCIPASFVVAKLMKLPGRSPEMVSEWIKKVPSIDALWEYIHQLNPSMKSKSLTAREDCKASLQQCHMDLTAHLSYILSTQGTQEGFAEWEKWVKQKIGGLSTGTKLSVLQLPTLQLLKQAIRPPASFQVIRSVIRSVILRNIIEIPHPRSFRRELVFVLMSNSSQMCNLETAMMVMHFCRPSFTSFEVGENTARMLQEWMNNPLGQSRSLDIKWVHLFLSESMYICQDDGDFETRAKLARVKAQLEGFEWKSGLARAGVSAVAV